MFLDMAMLVESQVYNFVQLRLLFSLKPKEIAKLRFLAIWIDQK